AAANNDEIIGKAELVERNAVERGIASGIDVARHAGRRYHANVVVLHEGELLQPVHDHEVAFYFRDGPVAGEGRVRVILPVRLFRRRVVAFESRYVERLGRGWCFLPGGDRVGSRVAVPPGTDLNDGVDLEMIPDHGSDRSSSPDVLQDHIVYEDVVSGLKRDRVFDHYAVLGYCHIRFERFVGMRTRLAALFK